MVTEPPEPLPITVTGEPPPVAMLTFWLFPPTVKVEAAPLKEVVPVP